MHFRCVRSHAVFLASLNEAADLSCFDAEGSNRLVNRRVFGPVAYHPLAKGIGTRMSASTFFMETLFKVGRMRVIRRNRRQTGALRRWGQEVRRPLPPHLFKQPIIRDDARQSNAESLVEAGAFRGAVVNTRTAALHAGSTTRPFSKN